MRLNILKAGAAASALALALAACSESDEAAMDDEAMTAETEMTDETMDDMADETAMEDEEPMETAEAEPAPPPGPPGGMAPPPTDIAINTIPDPGATIDVMPDNLDPEDGEIAERYSSYGDNVAPAVEWSAVDGAESYVLIMQDPVDMGGNLFIVLHWLVYNIPGDVTSLPEGIQPGAEVAEVPGAMQAANISGDMAYAGPRPPGGRPPHQYTFQVFALDTTLDVPADVTYAGIMEAMDGHVIAAGSTVTPYSPPADAAPMGPPPPQQ